MIGTGSKIVSLTTLLLLAQTSSLSADQKAAAPAISSQSPAIRKPQTICPAGWHPMPISMADTFICVPDKPALRCGPGTSYVEHKGPPTRVYGYGGPFVDVPDCSIGCQRLRTSPQVKAGLSKAPSSSAADLRTNPRCPSGWHMKPGTYKKDDDGVEQFMCLPDRVATKPPCHGHSVAAECDCGFGCVVGIN